RRHLVLLGNRYPVKMQKSGRDLQYVSLVFLRTLLEARTAREQESLCAMIARAKLSNRMSDNTQSGRADFVDGRLGAPQYRYVGEIVRAFAREEGPYPKYLFDSRAACTWIDQRSERAF